MMKFIDGLLECDRVFEDLEGFGEFGVNNEYVFYC